MIKNNSVIYLMILALVVLLVLTSCDGRKGMLNVNEDPTIIITNYFGADSTNQITESHLFQQTVQWSGTDEDGWVVGYAFRVLNEDGVPIATPGYDVITVSADSTEAGWVKFYTPNADQSIPLNQSAQTTIWNDQSYATINFPAADASGDSAHVISILEVKCIDNSGNVSDLASKYFQAHSNIPSALIRSNINGETIGTAIIFEFMMNDNDPFVGSIPYYYEYKLQKRNMRGDTLSVAEGGYTNDWISTLGYSDISLALHSDLRPESEGGPNALIPNMYENEVLMDSTFLLVRAVDAAKIVSDFTELSFIVKEGFYPGTVIYFGDGNSDENGIYSLGTNHFATYIDESILDVLQNVQTSDGPHYSTPFWYNEEEKYCAIGSNDLKTYMRWGYNGEFEDNNPQKEREDLTLDEITGQPYFCEIVGYDLRLDGEPYYYPPIPAEGVHLQVDDDGKQWLRVGANYPIGRATTITLTSYGGSLDNMYGEHIFEVRAIDLQGAVDETPHEFHYTIYPLIPKEEKSGVLIIDDEMDNNNAPGELIDSLYTYYVSNYDSDPGYINMVDRLAMITANQMGGLHFGKSIIAPSDIQQYKVIIYHADNPTSQFDFWKEYEAFKIFLLQGGNLILSSGSNLKTVHQRCSELAFDIFDDYFGISMSLDNPNTFTNEDAISFISTNYSVNPFFIQAVAEDGYNDIDLLLPSFNSVITNPNPNSPIMSLNGLGPVAYFNNYESDVFLTYGCRNVGKRFYQPTQELFEEYNGKPVALKKVTENNSCYIFGIPLAYMEPDQVKTMMTQILNEIP